MTKSKTMTALALLLLPLLPLATSAQAEVVTDQSRIAVSVPQIPSSERIDFPASPRSLHGYPQSWL